MSTIAVNILVALAALVAAIIYSNKTELALQKIHEVIQRKPGCNLYPSVGNVTFHYFAGRGRGEAIRLLMANSDISWSETKFTANSWPNAKLQGIDSGLYTFGQGKTTRICSRKYGTLISFIRKHFERTLRLDLPKKRTRIEHAQLQMTN